MIMNREQSGFLIGRLSATWCKTNANIHKAIEIFNI